MRIPNLCGLLALPEKNLVRELSAPKLPRIQHDIRISCSSETEVSGTLACNVVCRGALDMFTLQWLRWEASASSVAIGTTGVLCVFARSAGLTCVELAKG